MILVADCSALVALSICDSLHLLETLFTTVAVPESVYLEATKPDKRQAQALKHFLQGIISSVWHSASATFLSQLLNIEIPENRLQVKMRLYDSLTPIQTPEANRQPAPRQHSLSNKFVN